MRKFFTITSLVALYLFTSGHSATAQQTKSSGLVQLLPGYEASIELTEAEVTLFLSGPVDRWFALGFNSTQMANGVDVVYFANGAEGATLYDGRLTGNAPPVADTMQDWEILSNELTPMPDPRRQIIAKRPLATGNPNDFDFSIDLNSLNIIFSRGATATNTLAYHQNNRGFTVLQFSDVTSVESLPALDSRVSIYPNPSSDVLNLYFKDPEFISSIRIFDISGRIVDSFSANSTLEFTSIPVSNLPAGTYFLELNTKTERALKRFIVE
jgi:hypothetical protein